MRKLSPRYMSLLLTLITLTSGTAVSSINAEPVNRISRAADPSAKTSRSQDAKQARYDELLRQRAEATARAKAKLEKIRTKGAEIAARTRNKKSPKTKVSFFFSSADTQGGIIGGVSDTTTGATILFESKRDGDHLTSRIKDLSGKTLIEYIEAERALVTDPLTQAQTFEPVPVLRINSIEFTEMQGAIVDDMRHFATSPQGELLRLLALYVVEYVPGEDLEMERRGLEVPFQSMQKFYEKLAIDEYGGGELSAAKKFGAKRVEELKGKESYKQHEPLVSEAVDCEQFQCLYVDNHDYQLSAQGGYVVKSLSPRLGLSHNFARPTTRVGDEHHDHEKAVSVKDVKPGKLNFKAASFNGAKTSNRGRAAVVKPFDDDSQVGDCFGRCGGGCGNWSHEWIGEITPYLDYTYCEAPDRYTDMPNCSTMCCSTERRVTSYSGIAVHTAHGKVTLGSKAHDSCVRSLGGPSWLLSLPGMPCFPALLLAADCGIPGIGDEHTWSYIGPHAEGYDYYTGNCCVAIGREV